MGAGDDAMRNAVVALRERLGIVRLPLRLDRTAEESPGSAALPEVLAQLDDYVIPRLQQLDAPLLTVVGGSTGAGKSTLVNSIVGSTVTASGVLRPTTRAPVLAHHPGDARWFSDARILPTMPRSSGGAADLGGLHLVADEAVPQGLALLDAPDLDSVVARNRELAGQLLAAADLWIFVTTATRYADAVPWEMLHAAADRGTALAVVLNRTPADGADEVTRHLAEMLSGHDLGDAPLFVVAESALDARDLLAPEAVAPIRDWLVALGADAAARGEVARRTVEGAVRSLSRRVSAIAAQADHQVAAYAALSHAVDAAYEAAAEQVDEACRDGSLLRGEVLARWQEFVGTGEVLRLMEERLGAVRDRITDFFRARPGRAAPPEEIVVALESGLEAVILEQADAAAERTASVWASFAGGAQLLQGAEPLARRSPDLAEVTARAVRDWQGYVLDLVRAEGQGRRMTARFLSFGVNGLGVALMVVVFAHTGGLTGLEVGVAGGTGIVGQRVLEAVFGDQAVRQLTTKAREDLQSRVRSLLSTERARFDQRLGELSVDVDAGPDLRMALRRLEAAQ